MGQAKQSSSRGPRFERVLVLDGNAANAKFLADLLRSIEPACRVSGLESEDRALSFAREFEPQIIFVELKGPRLDGLEFTRRLRRSDFSCREAPVIMVTSEATAAAIVGARDAGVHEFLRRPYNLGDLQKRLDAVTLKQRDWIEAMSYVGPDRRRFNSSDYSGPRKRRSDKLPPAVERISRAIRIVTSALAALDTDRVQALRALLAQARIIVEISAGKEELKRLGATATALDAYLRAAAQGPGLSREQLETFLAHLIEAAPAAARPEAA